MATKYTQLKGTEHQSGNGNEIELAEKPGYHNGRLIGEPIEDSLSAMSSVAGPSVENIVQNISSPVEKVWGIRNLGKSHT
jgi:hypothetical protein